MLRNQRLVRTPCGSSFGTLAMISAMLGGVGYSQKERQGKSPTIPHPKQNADVRNMCCVVPCIKRGKLLPGRDFALVFVNNFPDAMNATCDAGCFKAMGVDASTSYTPRDLWSHADGTAIKAPFTFTAAIPPYGGVMMYRFTPVSEGVGN